MDITNIIISNVMMTNFTNITNEFIITNDLTHVVEVMNIPVDGWTIFGVIVTFASAMVMCKSVEEMKKQNKISADSVKEMNEQYIQNEKNKQQEQDFQIYFQVLQPLFQRFNDTVDKYWGKDENHRSSIIPPSIPEDFDYHTMVIDVSSIYNSIKDTLLILHVPEDSFKDINEFLSNMYDIDRIVIVYSRTHVTLASIKKELQIYHDYTTFWSPLIFDYIFQTIGLYYLGKALPQDKKEDIERFIKGTKKHKRDWEILPRNRGNREQEASK